MNWWINLRSSAIFFYLIRPRRIFNEIIFLLQLIELIAQKRKKTQKLTKNQFLWSIKCFLQVKNYNYLFFPDFVRQLIINFDFLFNFLTKIFKVKWYILSVLYPLNRSSVSAHFRIFGKFFLVYSILIRSLLFRTLYELIIFIFLFVSYHL